MIAWVVGAPTTAQASPWALPAERMALTANVEYAFAGQEFLDSRRSQPFPLEGFFQSTTLTPAARFGVGAGFDVELAVPLRVVSFSSDPVILVPGVPGPGQDELDAFQESVLNLSQDRAGVADIELAVRKQWIRGRTALSTQVVLKIPAGYDGPAGTFGESPETEEEFLADPVRFAQADNITDDVTLGDGQVDVTGWLHAGTASDSGLFLRAAVGLKYRFDGAANQVLSEARVGQLFARRVIVYAGYRWTYSIEEGRRIGISVAAIDPELPATEFRGLDNLLLRELQLEQDTLRVGGGFIFKLSPKVELNLGYEQTVWGRNVAATRSLQLSIGYLLSLFGEV